MREAKPIPRNTASTFQMSSTLPIRAKLGLTQEEFAARFGFSKGAVRDWEQRRKVPEASARILLRINGSAKVVFE